MSPNPAVSALFCGRESQVSTLPLPHAMNGWNLPTIDDHIIVPKSDLSIFFSVLLLCGLNFDTMQVPCVADPGAYGFFPVFSGACCSI
jgi:hypothetical protein